jgi:predicted unusual protein kinase regulating ubiquinone biosynthesis (AarF/ABC1/UbiB family)
MGGVLIKVGQFLSARLDVLPKEITSELSGLQDEVEAETYEAIRSVVEAEFGVPLEEKFSDFSPIPIASASIGQAHQAYLKNPISSDGVNGIHGAVVVKVQRPEIEELVKIDLSAIKVVISWLYRYQPIRKRANLPALLGEFSRTLYEELDYLHEGKNAETFKANFASRPDICVPGVVWSHTTRRVLTLEDVRAIKITDYEAIDAAGISRPEVANRLIDTYLKQIFEDHFFHADPHPGNLFVWPSNDREDLAEKTWKLVFVDFGMTGSISPKLVDGLRECLIAIGTHDSARLIKSYQLLDLLLPGADLDLLERASSLVFDRIWGKATSEIMNMRHSEAMELANEFGDLIYEMPFQVPQDLILLGRSLAILSGMCSGLDPEFNVWESLVPYAKKLIETENGGSVQYWLKEIGAWVVTMATLPKHAETVLSKLEQGKLEVRTPELKFQVNRLEYSIRQLVGAILFAVFVLTSVQTYLAGHPFLAGLLGFGGIVSLFIIIARR